MSQSTPPSRREAVFERWLGQLDRYPVTDRVVTMSEVHLQRFDGVVPEFLIRIWRRFGFAGLFDGAIWFTDPLEWADVAAEMLRGVTVPGWPAGSLVLPLARSAFGEFWFYSPGNSGWLGVHPGTGHMNADGTAKYDGEPDADIMSWFNRINDYPSLIEPEFTLLDEVCGTLAYDECYAYTPALTAGGKARDTHASLVLMRDHLHLLDNLRRRPSATLSADYGMFDPDGELIYRLESYGPNERPANPYASGRPDEEIIADIVTALRVVADETLPDWRCVVLGLARVGRKSYQSAVIAYSADEGRLSRSGHWSREMRRNVTALLTPIPWEQKGLKLIVYRAGRTRIERTEDAAQAVSWTARGLGSPPVDVLVEAMRPRML